MKVVRRRWCESNTVGNGRKCACAWRLLQCASMNRQVVRYGASSDETGSGSGSGSGLCQHFFLALQACSRASAVTPQEQSKFEPVMAVLTAAGYLPLLALPQLPCKCRLRHSFSQSDRLLPPSLRAMHFTRAVNFTMLGAMEFVPHALLIFNCSMFHRL